MGRFSGKVGFVQTVETSPGVFSEVATERNYKGDVIRETLHWDKGEQLNDSLRMANRFSIVADDYANENFSFMRYVEWAGVLWKISHIEIQRPRLILSIGDKYNAP